ncbi:hypothetical protein COOONC_18642 [Cooperia oncophora]
MFLNKVVMFLLIASTIDVYGVKFKIQWNTETTECKASDTFGTWGLRIDHHLFVIFDKQTRLIKKRHSIDQTHNIFQGETYFEYDGDMNSVDIGVYSMIVREGVQRRNENPFTNPNLAAAKTIHGRELTPPGSGTDFSRIYHEAPFALWWRFSEMKPTGETEVLKTYGIGKCAHSKKWIADEGFYKLSESTGQYDPIYYDPKLTDFYY